jgi:hypothetical protein
VDWTKSFASIHVVEERVQRRFDYVIRLCTRSSTTWMDANDTICQDFVQAEKRTSSASHRLDKVPAEDFVLAVQTARTKSFATHRTALRRTSASRCHLQRKGGGRSPFATQRQMVSWRSPALKRGDDKMNKFSLFNNPFLL